MAVTIRLARYGATKRPYYRVVATEKTNRRDGKFIERLGSYNPLLDPAVFNVKEDRLRYWLGNGARTTDILRRLVIKHFPGVIEERENHKRAKIQEARHKRKTRQKSRPAAK